MNQEVINAINIITKFLAPLNLNEINEQTKLTLFTKLKADLKKKKINVDSIILSHVWNKHFNQQYKFETDPSFHVGFRSLDSDYDMDEIKNKNIIVPKKYEKIYEQFVKLYNTDQPEQRSDAWFKYRSERITASSVTTALGESKYNKPEKLIIEKCDTNTTFPDNIFTHHGKKYEQIATLIYEHMNNIRITEFGCIPHHKIDFLGASPDGICSKSTLDYKFSPLVGRMLEIKCPYSRKIIMSGEVDNVIIPHDYYLQVLLQLECCDLQECDFFQVRLTEYATKYDFENDMCDKTEVKFGETGKSIDIPDYCKKGAIIQLLPKNKINLNCMFDSKFIYPPTLNLTIQDYDKWIADTVSNWKEKNPELSKDYVINSVKYWKMEKCHTITVKRDDKWFKQSLPKLTDFWTKVKYFRENKEDFEKLKLDHGQIDYDTKINAASKKLIGKKKLFLDDSSDDECDFIDDD
jgi:putative phage-type endonuclease